MVFRKNSDFHLHIVFQEYIEPSSGGRLSRWVGVEYHDYVVGMVLQQPHLRGRQGGSAGGGRIPDAMLAGPYLVEITFDNQDLVLFAD